MTQHATLVVSALRRRMAGHSAAQAACAVLALLGWVPVAGLVLEHTAGLPGVPSAWPWVGLCVLLLAAMVAAWSARCTALSAAARHLDSLAGRDEWAIYTAWELRGAPGPFPDAVRANATRLLHAAPAAGLPAWRHPIAVLLAVLWISLALWLWLVEPPRGAGSLAPPANSLRADDFVPLQHDAVVRGDAQTADALQALRDAVQSGDMNSMADALRAYEQALADRLKRHQRQSEMIREVDEARDRLQDDQHPLSDAEWKELLKRLADTARDSADPEAAAEIEKAMPMPLTDEQRLELLDKLTERLDGELASDRREIDRLELMLQAVRRAPRTTDPAAMNTPPATAAAGNNPIANQPADNNPGNPRNGTRSTDPGTGSMPADAPTNAPPAIPLQARPADAPPPAIPADSLPPAVRPLAERFSQWQREQGR